MSGPRTGAARRIGLYGGSFDPVHVGHLHAARAALAAFDLDRIVFVPAATSPHKLGRRPMSGAHRRAALELAIAGEPRFSTSSIELDRGGPSYTIDTVRALPAHLGEDPRCALYLILGSDNLMLLSTWRSARELLERVQPIVVHRGGDPEPGFARVERDLGPAIATKVRDGYLHLPPVPASSTDVRARLAGEASGGARADASSHGTARGEASESASAAPSGAVDEVPAVVRAYLREHGLYTRREGDA